MNVRTDVRLLPRVHVQRRGRYVYASMLAGVNIAQHVHGTPEENEASALRLCQSWPEWDGGTIAIIDMRESATR